MRNQDNRRILGFAFLCPPLFLLALVSCAPAMDDLASVTLISKSASEVSASGQNLSQDSSSTAFVPSDDLCYGVNITGNAVALQQIPAGHLSTNCDDAVPGIGLLSGFYSADDLSSASFLVPAGIRERFDVIALPKRIFAGNQCPGGLQAKNQQGTLLFSTREGALDPDENPVLVASGSLSVVKGLRQVELQSTLDESTGLQGRAYGCPPLPQSSFENNTQKDSGSR